MSAAPTSTTNITGFLTISRGSSLRTRRSRPRAHQRRVPDTEFLCLCHVTVARPALRTSCPRCIRKCSTIGPRLSTGKNVRTPTMTITPTSSVAKSGVVTGNVPSDGGTCFLRPRLPASASIGMMIMKRPISIAMPIVVLYHFVLARDAGERRAVVAGARRVGVEDLGQAVRPGIRDARGAEVRRHRRDAGEAPG